MALSSSARFLEFFLFFGELKEHYQQGEWLKVDMVYVDGSRSLSMLKF
jgi:hypothetical protein